MVRTAAPVGYSNKPIREDLADKHIQRTKTDLSVEEEAGGKSEIPELGTVKKRSTENNYR